MAKINYRARMRKIHKLTDALCDAVNALRQDINDAGDDASVTVDVYEGSDAGTFSMAVWTSVTTTY